MWWWEIGDIGQERQKPTRECDNEIMDQRGWQRSAKRRKNQQSHDKHEQVKKKWKQEKKFW